MGFFSSPDGTAPSSSPQSVTPVSNELLIEWLKSEGSHYFVDSDGDIGGLWSNRMFYFFLMGKQNEVLQIRGRWNRDIHPARKEQVLEMCNTWNRDKIFPKCYARTYDDDGESVVRLYTEVSVDLEHGVTLDQLGLIIRPAIGTATSFFDWVAEEFPDPAAQA